MHRINSYHHIDYLTQLNKIIKLKQLVFQGVNKISHNLGACDVRLRHSTESSPVPTPRSTRDAPSSDAITYDRLHNSFSLVYILRTRSFSSLFDSVCYNPALETHTLLPPRSALHFLIFFLPPNPTMSDPRSELQSTLRDLAIGEKGPVQDIPRPAVKKLSTSSSVTSAPKPTKKAKEPVADSWEDEADLSEDEPAEVQDLASSSVLSPTLSMEGPLDPPPTPISPQTSQPWGNVRASSPATGGPGPARRPEKQTAVAGRLIAGALGIRAPKRTEEQRAYDRSVKEQEIKRRNREREEAAKAKEEEEKLKASVWTD